MRAVIQRVSRAQVSVDGKVVSQIKGGILTLLGIAQGDTDEQLERMIQKICELRIFEDKDGKMNLSLQEIKGEHLIVSQFTLLGDCTSGRRPSFLTAEKPGIARLMFDKALELSAAREIPTQGGIFQTHMKVELENDGPVTFVIEI